jgi:hypothetical protein
VPLFVRAGLRYDRWLETEGLTPLDFPADVIGDLKTTGGELSVYEVTGTISAERIAIAVAATKSTPGPTAYAVFDRTAVEHLGIAISTEASGSTPDSAVNALHRDLRVESVRKLLDVAGVIAGADIVPILKKKVVGLLKDGFESGRLDYTKNPALCDRVKANVPGRQTKPAQADE